MKCLIVEGIDDPCIIMKALYEADANCYLIKPIRLQELEYELRKLKLIA